MLTSQIAIASILASHVTAHGYLIQPPGLNNQKAAKVNGPDACGQKSALPVNNDQLAAGKTILVPGSTVSMTFLVQNDDGAGPINVQFDRSGTGVFGGQESTENATVTKQVPGVKGNLKNQNRAPYKFSFVVPVGLDCPGGCLMRVSQADRQFGDCAVIATGDKNLIPDVEDIKGKPKNVISSLTAVATVTVTATATVGLLKPKCTAVTAAI